jgi:hypothetical protein
MTFTRRRLVSPRPDRPEDVRDRLIRRRASALAVVDVAERFPTITPDNVRAALDYQEARIAFHVGALGGAA